MTDQRLSLPSWLQEHVDEDAELLAREIRTAAVAKARTALVDDYAAALIAALTHPPDPARVQSRPERHSATAVPQPPAAQRAPARSASAATDAVWMYAVVGITEDARAVGQRGIRAGAPVRRVTVGDVAALVSDVNKAEVGALAESSGAAPDMALIDAVRAHDSVIDTAFRSGPVVPLRFGTVVADDGAVAAVLREHGETLARELNRLDSAREWGVTVSELPTAVRPERPAAPAATTGAGYLKQRSSERSTRARERQDRSDAVGRIADELAALAEDARQGPVRQEDDGRQVLLNLSFLIRGTAESEFLQRCDELAQALPDQGLRLDRSGPWPPYHFVSVELEVDGA